MSEKKQNFLQGTAMLAMATAIVKVIGALYKIPLNAIIGTQGFGYYSTAYEIYAVLLMISTAGLPVAMSRMISQASALGHNNQALDLVSAGVGISLVSEDCVTARQDVAFVPIKNWHQALYMCILYDKWLEPPVWGFVENLVKTIRTLYPNTQ